MKKWWLKNKKPYSTTSVANKKADKLETSASRTHATTIWGVAVLAVLVAVLAVVYANQPVSTAFATRSKIAVNAYEPGTPQMTGDDDQAASPGYTPPIEQNQNQNQSSGKDITLSHSSLGDNSIQVTVPSMQTSDGPSIWTTTMNGIYEMNYPDYLGGDVTFCDGSNMISMGNNMKVGTSYNDYASLFPLYCGNDSLVWRCNITKQGATGNANNPGGYGSYANITCDFPSQESVDNGSAMTLGKYKQMQEEAGITYEDSVGEGEDGDSEDAEDTCNAGFFGFGWIFCPGQNLITNLLDGMMGWIEGSMKWTLLANQVTSADGTSVQDVWQKFLNIANIVFVIGFLVMIYSMATSTGISNYDIKKMLPRLIIVAVAVNLSFYICAALVDLSNIVGAGMYDLIYSNATSGDKWNIIGNIANIASSIVLLVLALFLFGGSVIIAFAVIIACLAFRQVALVVLIIISPIAIALYMLPNTEKWARKWFDMFVRLLIVYPAFTAVWGAARLISNTFATNTGASTIPGFVMDFVCAIAPAVAIIPLFKMSGGVMAMAAGAVSGAAARTGIANRVNKAGRHAVVNNPATRGATSRISSAAGRFATNNINTANGQGRFGAVAGGARRWAGRKALGIANAAGKHSDAIASEVQALDASAMEIAKTSVGQYSVGQQREILKSGKLPDGKDADQYIMRTIANDESVTKGMQAGDVETMMVNAAKHATDLQSEGRMAESQKYLNSIASAANSSGNWLGGNGAMDKFKSLDKNWKENAQQAYDSAIVNRAGNISQDALTNTSAANQSYMNDKLNDANNNTVSPSIAGQLAHWRDTSNAVRNDPKATAKMDLKAQQQLINNQQIHVTPQNAAAGVGLDSMADGLRRAEESLSQAMQSGNRQLVQQAQSSLNSEKARINHVVDSLTSPRTGGIYNGVKVEELSEDGRKKLNDLYNKANK